MKNRFLFLLPVMLLTLLACNQSHEMSSAIPVTDSLMKPWISAWNSADAEKIANLFADDALVILPGVIFSGIDSVKTKWVVPTTLTLRNLTIQNLKEDKTSELASFSGSYMHDWVRNDSVISRAGGYYTFMWRKQADNSWKMAVVNIN
jgi:ketosteroid isomerase-like protein